MKCSGCIHESGLWGDSMCVHNDYCQKCSRHYSDLRDNYQSAITDERALYENLKRKYENR